MHIQNYIFTIIILISIVILYEALNFGYLQNIKEAMLNIKKPNTILYDIDTQLDEKENNGDIVEFKDDNFNFKINIVKTYLEDPLMRGSNVFDSEQYSRLFDIGEIKLDNNSKIPKPTHFIGNPYN